MSQRLLLWLTTEPEQKPEPVARAAPRCSQVRGSSSEPRWISIANLTAKGVFPPRFLSVSNGRSVVSTG